MLEKRTTLNEYLKKAANALKNADALIRINPRDYRVPCDSDIPVPLGSLEAMDTIAKRYSASVA